MSMNKQRPPGLTPFLVTKEYRRFAEFCDACRRHRYIGLCYGVPGVGKTLSAHYYAQWDVVLAERRRIFDDPPAPEPFERRTVVYTAPVVGTPQAIARELLELCGLIDTLVRWGMAFRQGTDDLLYSSRDGPYTELVIVDEADRLKTAGLEQVRDLYDRGRFGLVLLGMPGLEKRLARYPQLYSRVGFVHEFRPLSGDESHFILEQKWSELGLTFHPAEFADAEAVAAVIRITGGNFRLLQRLFAQIERILQINELHLITKEVVEAAREGLIIGIS
jgi:DNA transposition AAA+ family ATPase